MSEKTIPISANLLQDLNDTTPRFMSAMIGTQFKNHRDFYTVFGWERRITSLLCYSMYKTYGVARAINDIPVDTTWRYYPKINSSNSDFVSQFNALDKRLNLMKEFKRADRLSGIGTYSIMVLNIKGQKYESKLTSFKLENLTGIKVYHEAEVEIEQFIDKTGARYGIKSYRIGVEQIHPSRVIHIAEKSDDDVIGQSRIGIVYNQLNDMIKISGSTAELYYITASLLLNAKAVEGFKVNKADAEALQDKLYELVNRMKGFITTSGFEIQNIAPDITSPKDSWDVYEKTLSSTSGIPRRILFGSEMGQLASTQDQTTFYERIQSRQVSYINPDVIGALIERLMAYSDLVIADYEITWGKLSALSDKEVSESVAQYARAIKDMYESGMPESTSSAIFKKIEELIKSG